MRSITLGSAMRRPSASRYSKPLPRRRRRMPVSEQSTRLSLAMAAPMPARAAAQPSARPEGVGHALERRRVAGRQDPRAHVEVEARRRPGSATAPPASRTISCAAATSTERTSRRVSIASRRPAATRHIEAATEPSARRRRALHGGERVRRGRHALRAARSPGRGSRAARARAARAARRRRRRPRRGPPTTRARARGRRRTRPRRRPCVPPTRPRSTRRRTAAPAWRSASRRSGRSPRDTVRPPPTASSPRSSDTAISGTPERLELGEHRVLGGLVDDQRRVAALAAAVLDRSLGRGRRRPPPPRAPRERHGGRGPASRPREGPGRMLGPETGGVS